MSQSLLLQLFFAFSLSNTILAAPNIPINITNSCPFTIWPAIYTQAGSGPTTGFELDSGATQGLLVDGAWAGRVWARTQCNFTDASNASIPSCSTGNCGNVLQCTGIGAPATLAEFAFNGSSALDYYDISLVDGYNLPINIRSFLTSAPPNNTGESSTIPPNLTNPSCIATLALIANQTDISANTSSALGVNETYPLPFWTRDSAYDITQWCPWNNQNVPASLIYRPGAGVYPYPTDNLPRPNFDPCLSDCSRYGDDRYCCAGAYIDRSACQPSQYAINAKSVCPDAYGYAYDDATSTFAVPTGFGFGITFCPPGRSTAILQTLGTHLQTLIQTGQANSSVVVDARNITLLQQLEGMVNGASSGLRVSPWLLPMLSCALACYFWLT